MMNQLLLPDDTGLMAGSQERIRQLVEEFWRVCGKRKLRVNESKSSIMKCMRMVDDRRMNRKLLGEVVCFKYLGSHNTITGEMDEGKFRINEIERVCGGMKEVFKSKSLGSLC